MRWLALLAIADVALACNLPYPAEVSSDAQVDAPPEQKLIIPSTVTVSEGTAMDFTVRLALPPAADVTVDIASTNPSVARLSATTLTFTPSDFDVAQTVTIDAPLDGDIVTDTATVNLVATGGWAGNGTVTVSVSDVRGGAWGSAQQIQTNISKNAINAPDIAMNRNGDAVAIWWRDAGSSSATIHANRWHAGGDTWLTLEEDVQPTSAPVQGDQARVAVDAGGNAIAVWSQQLGSNQYNLWSNRYVSGSKWGIPELIETDDRGPARRPQVAAGAGTAVAVWEQCDCVNQTVVWNHFSADSGWESAQLLSNLSNGADTAYWPRIAIDGRGNALAVWSQDDVAGGAFRTRASLYTESSGWSSPQTVSPTGASFSTVAIDETGDAIVAWEETGGIGANRYVGSAWGAAEVIPGSSGGTAVSAALDRQGDALVVWLKSDGSRMNVWADRYVPGSGWEGAVVIGVKAGGDAAKPQVAVDPSGSAIAVWAQSDGTSTNIWANRFLVATGWGTPQLLETDTGNASAPAVAIDQTGNAIAVWRQFSLSSDRIFAARFQ